MSREYSIFAKNVAKQNDTLAGNATDAYGAAIPFATTCVSVDIFIWDNAAVVKRSYDGVTWDDEFEIPANSGYMFDATTLQVKIKNKTAGSVARYSITGWYL